jgi:putative transposase
LKENGIVISMSRKGNPWDNAACESFMKTLKSEEVHCNEYRDLGEARSGIREFLEKSTTRNDLTPHLATCRRRSSKPISPHNKKEAAARQLY